MYWFAVKELHTHSLTLGCKDCCMNRNVLTYLNLSNNLSLFIPWLVDCWSYEFFPLLPSYANPCAFTKFSSDSAVTLTFGEDSMLSSAEAVSSLSPMHRDSEVVSPTLFCLSLCYIKRSWWVDCQTCGIYFWTVVAYYF